MHLLYLDDSGSVPNRDELHLVLGGISVFETQGYWIANQLEELARKLFPREDPSNVEFHASEIFAGSKAPWTGLKKKEDRIQVIKNVLSVLKNSKKGACAFACIVHKASYPGKDSMQFSFEDLCSRFDRYLKRIYYENGKIPQRGLIVLDKSSYETSLQQLAYNFRELGTSWGVLRNLSEVPLFVNSKVSRLVQLADHVAYAVFRRYEAKDTNYFDIIVNKFDSDKGVLHGLVHKQTSDRECMCPACMSRTQP